MKKKLILAAMAFILAAPAAADPHHVCSVSHPFWMIWLPPSC
jgi:hypothetical protein